eukprot:TRINITY_DN1066_c1_g1_i3.p1 TRINITY_DN1066_c1_g1~~TRINITY_DN1066_c1_g1_i3.p1  ORF type:complete len:431 (+),score=32.19 TRINITY_DN1066_c1_g1_i3:213-1505(+)
MHFLATFLRTRMINYLPHQISRDDESMNLMDLSEYSPSVTPLVLPTNAKRHCPEGTAIEATTPLTFDTHFFPQQTIPQPTVVASSATQTKPVPEVKTEVAKEKPGKRYEYKEGDKAKKLERNRLSAKESRERKKKYVQTLEEKIETLTQLLEEAKQKLAKYEYNSKLHCNLLQESACQIKPKMQQMVDKLLLAHQERDATNTKLALQNLFLRYGAQAEERHRAVGIFMKRTIELVLPLPYKYLIWAAEHNSGFYDIMNLCPNLDYNWDKKEKNEWETIIDHVKLNKDEFNQLHSTKEFLLKHAEALRSKVKSMLNAKNEVFNEVTAIDAYFQEKILRKMPVAHIGAFVLWLEKVCLCCKLNYKQMKNKPELNEYALFQLGEDGIEHVRLDTGNCLHTNWTVLGKAHVVEGSMKRRPMCFNQCNSCNALIY